MCSARSLGSRLSSSASASSSGRRSPRGRVPAMGRVSAQPSRSSETRRSGRRRDELVVAEVQVPGEGRGVDGAQRLVEVQARQRVDAVQALRQVGLEDVARVHVLAGAAHDLLVLRPREVGAEHREVVAVQGGGGVVARADEGCAHARRLGRRRALVGGEAVDEYGLAGGDVVAQQPAGQEDVDVRQTQIVARGVRQALEVPHGVVGEQAEEGLRLGQVVNGGRGAGCVARTVRAAGCATQVAAASPPASGSTPASSPRAAPRTAPERRARAGAAGEARPAARPRGGRRRPRSRSRSRAARAGERRGPRRDSAGGPAAASRRPNRAAPPAPRPRARARAERDRVERGDLEAGDERGHRTQSTRRRTRIPRPG